MSERAPEHDDYETWQDLQAVLDERDREYWESNEAESVDED